MTVFTAFILGCLATGALLWLVSRRLGFLAQRPEDYATGPAFDIRQHLDGPLLCDGVIYGPTGRVTSRFTANFNAHWDGNRGVMREHFRYDSGTLQDREWSLLVDEAGRVQADADDLLGSGTGQQSGSGLRLTYRIKLPDSAGGHVLDVVDWMYLLDNGTIINRSQFRKFGIRVAELVATIRPDEASAQNQAAA